MSIIVVNLQDNQAVFRIFIALLRFSFDSPMYMGCILIEQPSAGHRYLTQAQTAYNVINYTTSLTLIN